MAKVLDLVQDVGGEEDRLSAAGGLLGQRLELGLQSGSSPEVGSSSSSTSGRVISAAIRASFCRLPLE
ncbi:hypothetical protein [Spirillospora sp. NPDC048819]|uniref:hypothetical protein n=1 Tax=Spirillospora sp. NPDC048819 TaxID=3155268 RepID=UPI00340AD616